MSVVGSTRPAEYRVWIQEYLKRNDYFVRGKCLEASVEMTLTFPELTIVQGHVHCTWGKDGHVWCVDPDGVVVDPTSTQYDVVFHYEPWSPGDEVRVGRCMNCGTQLYAPVDTLDDEPTPRGVCDARENPEDPQACARALNSYYNKR